MDLLYAVPLGLVGGAVGLLFMLSLKRLQLLLQRMKKHLVLHGLLWRSEPWHPGRTPAADAVLG